MEIVSKLSVAVAPKGTGNRSIMRNMCLDTS